MDATDIVGSVSFLFFQFALPFGLSFMCNGEQSARYHVLANVLVNPLGSSTCEIWAINVEKFVQYFVRLANYVKLISAEEDKSLRNINGGVNAVCRGYFRSAFAKKRSAITH